jgi:AbrB family looped-hinge helix DNA binding protein
METVATTRMSSKGQIVIPEAIRKQLNLTTGMQFIVVGEGDIVILKAISAPELKPFDTLIQQARQQAEEAGLEQDEIEQAILKARNRQ